MMKQICEICRRRLEAGEGDLCRSCEEYHAGILAAYEAMYGREEREMERDRELSENREGYWDGFGWHDYEDEDV